MNNSVMGLDIAKNIFHLDTFIEDKAVKKKLKRGELLDFFANYPAKVRKHEVRPCNTAL